MEEVLEEKGKEVWLKALKIETRKQDSLVASEFDL